MQDISKILAAGAIIVALFGQDGWGWMLTIVVAIELAEQVLP